MGFHAGREYKSFFDRKTNGCIRCDPSFFNAISQAIKELGPWNLTVVETETGSKTNNEKVDPIVMPVVLTPTTLPGADSPNIPLVPAPKTAPGSKSKAKPVDLPKPNCTDCGF